MSHMVIYRGVDGKPGYHQTDDIHDAVNFVEQMRNEEGVEHARIFRLEEVVFEYRPYYRVELTDAASQSALADAGPAQLAETSGAPGSAQVGAGSEDGDMELVDETIDMVDSTVDGGGDASIDDAVDVDGANGSDDNGEVKADAGGAKKGLFGR